jgi:hypothetical protein
MASWEPKEVPVSPSRDKGLFGEDFGLGRAGSEHLLPQFVNTRRRCWRPKEDPHMGAASTVRVLDEYMVAEFGKPFCGLERQVSRSLGVSLLVMDVKVRAEPP